MIYKSTIPISVVAPALTVTFDIVTGIKGNKGVTVIVYDPGGSPKIWNCPISFTLLVYTTPVDDVALTTANTPIGAIVPLIFPEMAATIVLKTGFNI